MRREGRRGEQPGRENGTKHPTPRGRRRVTHAPRPDPGDDHETEVLPAVRSGEGLARKREIPVIADDTTVVPPPEVAEAPDRAPDRAPEPAPEPAPERPPDPPRVRAP